MTVRPMAIRLDPQTCWVDAEVDRQPLFVLRIGDDVGVMPGPRGDDRAVLTVHSTLRIQPFFPPRVNELPRLGASKACSPDFLSFCSGPGGA